MAEAAPPGIRQILRRAVPLMLAQVVPLAVSVALTATAVAQGRLALAGTIAMLGTIVSLSSIVTTGVGMAALRDLALRRRQGGELEGAVERNLAVANASSLLILAVAGVGVGAFGVLRGESAVGALVYYATLVPSLYLTAQGAVLSSVFQVMDRDRENLGFATFRSGLQVAVGIALLLALGDDVLVLAGLGASTSVITGILMTGRVRALRRAGMRITLPAPWAMVWKGLGARIAGSLDGVVFVVVFLAAQVVAAGFSIQIGAHVALAVSLVRLVVLPLKQLGLVVARLGMLAGSGLDLRTLCAAAYLVLTVPALALGGALAFGLLPIVEGPFWMLVLAQLLVEPFASVLFGYLKVARSLRAGLAGLAVAYGVVFPLGLWAVASGPRSASALWAVLLLWRVVFAVWVLVLALRRPAEGAELHGES